VAPTIYFVRHGETDWNAEGRLQGQRDVPLNDFGRVQAEEAGARLRALVARYEDLAFVASPLSRTRETMERLRDTIGLAPAAYRVDERLRELSFGRWEGLTWKEVRRADPKGSALRERDKWRYAPPGGESYAELSERIAPAFAELTRDTVVVSHGGVARALLVIRGAATPEDGPTVDIWQGRILVVVEGSGYVWA
jgi:probable phosphoglycerate mutase